MRHADIVSGAALFIGSLCMILWGIPAQIDAVDGATISPRALPYVCAVAEAVLSGGLVLARLRAPAAPDDTGTVLSLSQILWTGIVLGAVLGALFLLGTLGPLVAGGGLVLVLMLALGERRPLALIGLPAGLLGLGWLLIYQILGTAVV